MTLAAGFICTDGILIAADRRITGAVYTYSECKLTKLYWANGCALVAYAGNRDTNTIFVDELGKQLPFNMESSTSATRSKFESALRASVPAGEAFAAIFGFWLTKNPRPTMFLGNVMQDGSVRITEPLEHEIIGSADTSLARFHLHNIKAVVGGLSTYQAAIYAVRLIGASIAFDGQYVGGGIDAMTITPRSDIGKIGIGSFAALGEIASQVELMDYWYEAFFRQLTGAHKPNLDEFMVAVRRFRKEVGGKEDI